MFVDQVQLQLLRRWDHFKGFSLTPPPPWKPGREWGRRRTDRVILSTCLLEVSSLITHSFAHAVIYSSSPPTIPTKHLSSLKMSWSTFFDSMKLVDRQIFWHLNSEMFGQAPLVPCSQKKRFSRARSLMKTLELFPQAASALKTK